MVGGGDDAPNAPAVEATAEATAEATGDASGSEEDGSTISASTAHTTGDASSSEENGSTAAEATGGASGGEDASPSVAEPTTEDASSAGDDEDPATGINAANESITSTAVPSPWVCLKACFAVKKVDEPNEDDDGLPSPNSQPSISIQSKGEQATPVEPTSGENSAETAASSRKAFDAQPTQTTPIGKSTDGAVLTDEIKQVKEELEALKARHETTDSAPEKDLEARCEAAEAKAAEATRLAEGHAQEHREASDKMAGELKQVKEELKALKARHETTDSAPEKDLEARCEAAEAKAAEATRLAEGHAQEHRKASDKMAGELKQVKEELEALASKEISAVHVPPVVLQQPSFASRASTMPLEEPTSSSLLRPLESSLSCGPRHSTTRLTVAAYVPPPPPIMQQRLPIQAETKYPGKETWERLNHLVYKTSSGDLHVEGGQVQRGRGRVPWPP
jgi:hypothetical protein